MLPPLETKQIGLLEVVLDRETGDQDLVTLLQQPTKVPTRLTMAQTRKREERDSMCSSSSCMVTSKRLDMDLRKVPESWIWGDRISPKLIKSSAKTWTWGKRTSLTHSQESISKLISLAKKAKIVWKVMVRNLIPNITETI